MQKIEIKFRGDGGEKYAGPERRGVEDTGRKAEDRVADEIRWEIVDGVKRYVRTDVISTQIVFNKAPADCTDPDGFRDAVICSAVEKISSEFFFGGINVEQRPSGTAK